MGGDRMLRERTGLSRRTAALSSALILALFALATQAQAQTPSLAALELEVDVGFHGQYVPDAYVPIWVSLDYRGPPLRGELVLRQEIQRLLERPRALSLRRSIDLGPSARQRYEFSFPLSAYPPLGEERPKLVVEFVAHGRVLASQTVDLTSLMQLDPLTLLVYGGEAGYPRVLPTGERVAQLEPEELPQDWRSYTGVSRVYLSRVDLRRFQPSQAQALKQWLTYGGELVILAGPEFFLQDPAWLRDLLPVRIQLVDGEANVEPLPNREVLTRAGSRVLLVRGRVGRGWVYFSVLDLRDEGPLERAIWNRLVPPVRRESPSPSASLGLELFSQMRVTQPSRLVLGGLLGLYVIGIGLLTLWLLRYPRWLGSEASAGWRVLAILAAWVALHTLAVWGYYRQPALSSPVQSLEIGWIWGRAGEPWAYSQTWYSLVAKRPLPEPLEIRAARGALIRPVEASGLTLDVERDHLSVQFEPSALSLGEPEGLLIESVRPLPIRITGNVRGSSMRLYNESPWRLQDLMLWRDQVFYALGDLGPGEALEINWRKLQGRIRLGLESGIWSFEGYVKRELYAIAEREIQRSEPPWALLGWIDGDEEELARSPFEHRRILKLLLLEAPLSERIATEAGDDDRN